MNAMDRAIEQTLSGTLNSQSMNSFGSVIGDTTYDNCTFNFGEVTSPVDVCDTVTTTLSDPSFMHSDRSLAMSVGYGLASLTVGVLTFGVSLVGQLIWVGAKGLSSTLDHEGRADYIEYKNKGEEKDNDIIDVEEIKPLSSWERDQIEYKRQRLDSEIANQKIEEIQNQRKINRIVSEEARIKADALEANRRRKDEVESDYKNNVVHQKKPSIYDGIEYVQASTYHQRKY